MTKATLFYRLPNFAAYTIACYVSCALIVMGIALSVFFGGEGAGTITAIMLVGAWALFETQRRRVAEAFYAVQRQFPTSPDFFNALNELAWASVPYNSAVYETYRLAIVNFEATDYSVKVIQKEMNSFLLECYLIAHPWKSRKSCLDVNFADRFMATSKA